MIAQTAALLLRFSPSIPALTVALVTSTIAACDSTETVSLSGVVQDFNGGVVAGATVTYGATSVTTGADGRYELEDLLVGSTTIVVSAPGYNSAGQFVALVAGDNAQDFVLTQAGEWSLRSNLLVPLSELAMAQANGRIYMMGGYPASRVTAPTVQVYDIASDTWTLGPMLPVPNNHGVAASVDGKVYLIGGQTQADDPPGTNSYVNTVYELVPADGTWVAKATMPTARSGAVAVVLDGLIYVAGGRPPHESDFAVYDPAANTWRVLPDLPTPRNHFTGAALAGRVHYVGGRKGLGLGTSMTTVHEVFDPQTETWTTASPLVPARSGMNGVVARGCFHVWGGEGPAGMFPNHDFYDPRTDRWRSLANMPLPVHGVYGSAFANDLIWVSGGGDNVGGSSGTTHNQVYRPEVSCE